MTVSLEHTVDTVCLACAVDDIAEIIMILCDRLETEAGQ